MNTLLKRNLLMVLLAAFAILINQHYGNMGLYPIDSEGHFDAGYRVLQGEYPFKDYWAVVGPFIDYAQAFVFYLFGVSWQSYVLHASLINAAVAVATFLVLQRFQLSLAYSFGYALLFSVLAYTSSGTPYVDHHAALLSLLGVYCLMLAIKEDKAVYWWLLPPCMALAFLSKQVPSAYVMIGMICVLSLYALTQKKYAWIRHCIMSSVLFLGVVAFFGRWAGITWASFWRQYIAYSSAMGLPRFQALHYTFRGWVAHFACIYLLALPLLVAHIAKLRRQASHVGSIDFHVFLMLIGYVFALILSQLLTLKAIYIYFLIPIVAAFSHAYLAMWYGKQWRWLTVLILLVSVGAVYKYHLRYNQGRKFQSLEFVDFDYAQDARKIDPMLAGLRWHTPSHMGVLTGIKDDHPSPARQDNNRPAKEIPLIIQIKKDLLADHRQKMIITNYAFFPAMLGVQSHAPARWYVGGGMEYPLPGNPYFADFQRLLVRNIKKHHVQVIYSIEAHSPIRTAMIASWLGRDCFVEHRISKVLTSYVLKRCALLSTPTPPG